MKTLALTFALVKETKNTQKFEERAEEGTPPAVGTLYVQKWALGTPPPATLTVCIEAA